MWVLQTLGVFIFTTIYSYSTAENPISNPNFVVLIFKYNSPDENINDITVQCLGALVHSKLIVTSNSCIIENKDDYHVGVFDWSEPEINESNIIAVSKLDTLYLWEDINPDSDEEFLAGFEVWEIVPPVNDAHAKPIKLPNFDLNYNDGKYIRLDLDDGDNNDIKIRAQEVEKVDIEQCQNAFNTEKYEQSIVNCFQNDDSTEECTSQPGTPIVYGYENNESNEIDYYLFGLMYESNQCLFMYSNYNAATLQWLKRTMVFYDLMQILSNSNMFKSLII